MDANAEAGNSAQSILSGADAHAVECLVDMQTRNVEWSSPAVVIEIDVLGLNLRMAAVCRDVLPNN